MDRSQAKEGLERIRPERRRHRRLHQWPPRDRIRERGLEQLHGDLAADDLLYGGLVDRVDCPVGERGGVDDLAAQVQRYAADYSGDRGENNEPHAQPSANTSPVRGHLRCNGTTIPSNSGAPRCGSERLRALAQAR